MTPELFVGDQEPFLVYSRIDIVANLRVLIDQQVRATVYFNQNEDFIVTRILSMNPEFEELIFDMAMEHRTNEKLLASSGLTVVAFVNHIKVQFSLNRAEVTQWEDSPAFRARTPRSILRLQRRTAFRASTQIANSPYVLLSAAPDKNGRLDTNHLRVVDISATGFAVVAPFGHPVLTIGMKLQQCQLQMAADDAFDVDVEIRHVSVYKDGFGRDMCRAGCSLMRVSGAAEMSIQRYVNRRAVGAK
ncbi:MAG: flagellar brake protein [Burkholderiales bacterium]|nr:flagellar brake protein [Burkholderiales bacterium]